MDAVFGGQNFLTEIIWKRSSAHSDGKQGRKQHGRIHDVLLFYSKGADWKWSSVHTSYDEDYVKDFYKYVEEGTSRRYRLGDLTGPGGAVKGNPIVPSHGRNRYWRYTQENMKRLIAPEGRVVQTKPGAVPHTSAISMKCQVCRYKMFVRHILRRRLKHKSVSAIRCKP